ncbi:hypothetical protein AYO41_00510 [Verrucomicrobia bacterium SCGC AG-212-E04]|nr:hypothetical protein AYO41_00510 [Verrucomicrobia bacterium SCGC AG-212-E04]
MARGSEIIRTATVDDLPELREVAYRSKAHWGYDAAFMKAVAPSLAPTAEELAEGVHVLVRDGHIAGFSAFVTKSTAVFLDSLFVAPEWIRHGFGEKLWRHAVDFARGAGHKSFLIESDPNAEGFYLRMGARRVGDIVSPASGRTLPLLQYDV